MIGKQLRALRKQRGMTQAQLAAYLKTAKSTVSQYENDINEPDLRQLVRIADLFEVTLDELAGREFHYKQPEDRTLGGLFREELTEDESRYLLDSLNMYRKWIGEKRDSERTGSERSNSE